MPTEFLVAISVQLACQLLKVIIYSIRDKKIELKYFVTAGGIPSAHTAFVASLSTYLALTSGIDTPWFSVSLVFGFIVIYDAFRLRGHVQKHAIALNRIKRIMDQNKEEIYLEEQSEMVGHNLVEIATGLIIGIVYAFFASLIFP